MVTLLDRKKEEEKAQALTDGSLGVVDPVRSKKSTKGRDKDTPTTVWDAPRDFADFSRITEETQVVHEEGNAASRDGNTPFQNVHGLTVPPHLEANGTQQAVF